MNKIKVTEDIVYNSNVKKDIVIAHVSDIHFNINTKERDFDKLYQSINKIKPNYVMITGDTLDTVHIVKNSTKIKELVTFLADLAKEYIVIISIGNHDVLTNNDYRFFKKLNDIYNIYVLDNQIYEDENIHVAGFTIPMDYYYNIERKENTEILVNFLDSRADLTKDLPQRKVNIALIHSPIRLTKNEVIKRLSNYDIILTGHTHSGLVPNWLGFLFKDNQGIVGPNKGFFPEIARGKIEKTIGKHNITIIINGAFTKIGKKAGKALSFINILYNKSLNKVIIRKKRGINYEN